MRRILGRSDLSLRLDALDASHARRVAALHQSGGFARGWEAAECAALIADRSVRGDGAFLRGDAEPSAFVLSRIAADEAEILSIVVSPGCRGRGLSKALLGFHGEGLAKAGIGALFLEVDEANRPALALYRGLGFAEVGRRSGYYPKPDGTRATALVMRRDLP